MGHQLGMMIPNVEDAGPPFILNVDPKRFDVLGFIVLHWSVCVHFGFACVTARVHMSNLSSACQSDHKGTHFEEKKRGGIEPNAADNLDSWNLLTICKHFFFFFFDMQ